MSKNSNQRFPSVKNNLPGLLRKQSRQGTGIFSTKQQFLQENTDSQKKIHQINSQNQITKRIQNKLRMRKGSGSQKTLKDGLTSSLKDFQIGSEFIPDPIQNLKEQINSLWQNSQKIFSAITNLDMNVSQQVIRQQILCEASFILCQVTKGENLQNILSQKIKKWGQKKKCITKCQVKQEAVKIMFEDRLQKLSLLLKTR